MVIINSLSSVKCIIAALIKNENSQGINSITILNNNINYININ